MPVDVSALREALVKATVASDKVEESIKAVESAKVEFNAAVDAVVELASQRD